MDFLNKIKDIIKVGTIMNRSQNKKKITYLNKNKLKKVSLKASDNPRLLSNWI